MLDPFEYIVFTSVCLGNAVPDSASGEGSLGIIVASNPRRRPSVFIPAHHNVTEACAIIKGARPPDNFVCVTY
jgi:hypothetical protein